MKSLVTSFVIFLIVAEALAISRAGTEDQMAFIFLSLPAAMIVAWASLALSQLMNQWRVFPACAGLIIAGGVLGFLWTYVVAISLGPWVGAFGAPILLCWMAGGSSAGSACWLIRNQTLTRAIPRILAISVAMSFAVFSIPAMARRAANDQQILTFVFRYVPGNEDVIIEEAPTSWDHDELLTDDEKTILRKHYPTGLLNLEVRHSNGSGGESRTIVVVERPVDGEIKLAQPDHASVFYFQSGRGFNRFPRDAHVLDRAITLGVRQYDWQGTEYVALHYLLDAWDGSATGADVMRWNKKDIEQLPALKTPDETNFDGKTSPTVP